MSAVIRKPILTIPSETEGASVFRARLATLLLKPDTHIYIDTSFLMWMTKIGASSRQELVGWLGRNCDGRVHVPIWSAHEYLKHHVAGTIVGELAEKANEVSDLVGRTYTYFRPFMDEPVEDGGGDASAVRATARSALNSLDRVAELGRQWHKSYQKHAAEVIAFINAFTPESTTVYEILDDILSSGAGRFIGSVPPGYQDRRKKGSSPPLKGRENEAPPDSNRYGDLVFWKELLVLAKGAVAETIVIFSNDRKNDWHLGRSDVVDIDPVLLALRKAWRPVPRPHPMLVMEAKLAGIQQVELLDSPYLAAILREIAEDEVRSFSDVAIIPDGPMPVDENERRNALVKERLAEDARKSSMEAADNGYMFADNEKVLNSPAALGRALLDSRMASDVAVDALLDGWRSSVETERPLSEAITAATFAEFDHKALVKLARELHDRVLADQPGYLETVTDLASILDLIPVRTAASLYLGLLASMYLERASNASRLPPTSPIAQLLFRSQSSDYAVNGIITVSKRVRDNPVRPLYVPDGVRPVLTILFDTESDTTLLDQLRSLRIGEIELLNTAQSDETLNLASLFGEGAVVEEDAIVRKACEIFALPFDQVELQNSFGRTYSLTKTIGFKRPVDISIPKDRPDGE